MGPEIGSVRLGEEALDAGDWEAARAAFTAAVAADPSPDALDGLGRTLWWLGDVDGAIEHRERAYAALRERGNVERAAPIALWLAREYQEAVGNEPAGNGWLARAEGMLRDAEPGAAHGWLELTKGGRAFDPDEMRRRAEAARSIAIERADRSLEASSLALLGRALLLAGGFEEGISALDESMVAITSGEVTDPVVFGDVCCVVTLAAEEAGELERLMRWQEVIETYMSRHLHGPLISWCGTCGAEFFQAKGDLKTAEECLTGTIGALEGTGHRSRCIHPAAKLAELRILQGRIEEAERLLAGYEDLPESLRASVEIHRLRGEHAVAAALLLRRVNRVGDTTVAVPLLATLVEVQLAQGMIDEAGNTADRIDAIARRSEHPRLMAVADLAGGPSRPSPSWRCRSTPPAPGSSWLGRCANATRRSPSARPAWAWRRSSGSAPDARPMRPPPSFASSAAPRGRGRRTSACSRRASRRFWRCSATGSRIPRSPPACTSARRRRGTTSATSSPSST